MASKLILVCLLVFITLVCGQAEFCKELSDVCEEQACALACADCTAECLQLETYPVTYHCSNPSQSFSRYDVCAGGGVNAQTTVFIHPGFTSFSPVSSLLLSSEAGMTVVSLSLVFIAILLAMF